MAFKVKLKEINNPQFMGAFSVLANMKLPTKVSWNISRMAKQLKRELQEGREFYLDLLKKYSETDEKGELVPAISAAQKDEEGNVIKEGEPIQGTNVWLKNEDGSTKEEEFNKAFEEMLDQEVTIESYLISIDDLADQQIEPAVLEIIAAVIDDGMGGDNVVQLGKPQEAPLA